MQKGCKTRFFAKFCYFFIIFALFQKSSKNKTFQKGCKKGAKIALKNHKNHLLFHAEISPPKRLKITRKNIEFESHTPSIIVVENSLKQSLISSHCAHLKSYITAPNFDYYSTKNANHNSSNTPYNRYNNFIVNGLSNGIARYQFKPKYK